MIDNWDDIKKWSWDNLLLGNGFSIGVSPNFRYDSLLSVIDDKKVGMYPHARKLFSEDKIGTTNFEEVLKVIYHAYLVNFWNIDAIKSLYFNVRKSLIEAVRIAHVDYNNVDVIKIEKALSNYRKIFTTNYDLIPYWSIMNNNFSGYCDYFWSDGCTFDPKNTELWGCVTPIFYLHGAIHLRTEPNGIIKKVRATGETSIKEIIDETDLNSIPLFISEGKSEIKLRRIRENDYLNFCYNQFINLSGNLLVFGHGLDTEYDEHILQAIKSSSISKLAISVFSGMREENKTVFMSHIEEFFADSTFEIIFFESKTHPLSMSHV
ncbi:DUF4917 family protein [Dickeya oryzae]|uniref:DUF4917 family protein n=1 Tax=Dickeya oryzae TaxID=1240404 RepID=UPI0031680D0B